MDVKTLSTIIGHVSAATTLNTYTHITDEMRRKAALNIDQGIAKAEVQPEPERQTAVEPEQQTFVPIELPRRRPGIGCVSQINEHLWEGRYSPVWPDGKKRPRTEYPDGVNPRKKAIAAYLREHPDVTNKARIARELHMNRSTVRRYYDEVRVEAQQQG